MATLVVTNDDGIDAEGIAALTEACRDFGEPLVVAPNSPQSYMGHRVTTHMPIPVVELSPGRVSVGGTPADCARIALRCLAPEAAWLVSGINHGGNLGVDTYTSGTVAAAREAAILGYPAVAFSQYVRRSRPLNWEASRRRAARVLGLLMARGVPSRGFWNVNLPHPDEDDDPCEVVECPLDDRPLDVRFRRENGAYVFEGVYQSRDRHPGRDVDLCFSGRITITPMLLDMASS